MSREEKINHIKDLQRVIADYETAIDLMKSQDGHYSPKIRYYSTISKILILLKIKKVDGSVDYTRNDADDELRDVVVNFMTNKIAECNAEIDSYFCTN